MSLNPNETVTTAKLLKKEVESLRAAIDTGAGTDAIRPGILSAKGDIVTATADDTPAVISAGSNGQVLSADSSTSTGLKWIDAPTGNGSSGVSSVNGRSGEVELSASDVGLGNVNNTSDENKPISTAVQTALNAKANISSVTTSLAGKADLVDGKVPVSQLPEATGSGVQVWEWYMDTASEGAGVLRRYNDSGKTLTIVAVRVRANINPPEGADLIVDINKGANTIFTDSSNRPRVVEGTSDSSKVTSMDITAVSDGEYLVPDIDQVGSLVPGSGVLVSVTLQ